MDHGPPLDDETYFEFWDYDPEEDYEQPSPPAWRRSLLIGVAIVTVVAMAIVPLYNLINASPRPVAENGLEVCAFDYCIVQDELSAAGLGGVMSRFSNVHLDDAESTELAGLLVQYLNIAAVEVTTVNRIEGSAEGQYIPSTRTIVLERPARAWTVIHEVAHVVEPGHGEGFQQTLVSLAAWLDQTVVD